MSVEQELIRWVREATKAHEGEITADTPLISTGRLDSLRILGLIEFAEEQFEIRLLDEDMHPDNFESIAAVAQLIQTRVKNRQQV